MSRSRRRARNPSDPARQLERRLDARSERFWLLGLLAGMIALRVLLLLELAAHPNKSADAELFLDLARRIAGGDLLLRGESLVFNPFYSWFLAAVFAVVGEKPALVLVVQCTLGVGGAFLLWKLARALFGPLAALFTLALHLFCGIVLFFESQLMDATFSVTLTIAALFGLHRAGATGRFRTWLGAGALLGLLALARPNALSFLPFAAGWAFWRSADRSPPRRRLGAATAVALGGLLCILPFTLRNVLVTGEPVLITAHGGINFWVGNNPNATGFFTPPDGMPPLPGPFNLEVPREAAQRATARTMSDAEVSSYWFGRGLAFVRENPGRALGLTLRKIRAFLNGREIPINVDFEFFRELSRALRLAFLPMGILLPLGILGLVRAAPRGRDHVLFVLFFVVYAASVVAFFVAARYRLPVVPVLLLYAGFAIRALLGDVRRPARLGAWLAGLALLLVVSRADLGVRLNPATVAHARGYTLETMQRYDEAIAYYGRALAADPRLVLTHLRLARIFARRGDALRAGEHYEAAYRLVPDDPGVRAEVENFRRYVRERLGR